ncbi:Protein of uncharacterised function (DUF1602) [Mycobacteroides abscessus subsp. abscessus]|nr:Protein of uncharacterised function (DUF1602) [Mycobacteroides abscessus subsp. abscessus]
MPAVGSSRKTSSGRPTSAHASARRCCCPPDSRRYGVRAASVRPSVSNSHCGSRGFAEYEATSASISLARAVG